MLRRWGLVIAAAIGASLLAASLLAERSISYRLRLAVGGGIETRGGVQVTMRVDAGRDPRSMAERATEQARAMGFFAAARAEGENLVLDLDGASAAEGSAFERRVTSVAFHAVDSGSAFMETVASLASRDPRARELGVTSKSDSWHRET